MTRRLLAPVMGVIAMTLMLAAPTAAIAAGSPSPFTSLSGVAAHGVRYQALPGQHGTTDVHAIAAGTSTGIQRRTIDGEFAIPAVTLRGAPGGLSADGRTLVLVDRVPNLKRGPTHVLILDAHSLTVRERLTFTGAYTFDAISPDGSAIYFIQYLSPNDQTRYAVRAYDVEAGQMLPNPIVDPDEHAGEMRGYPLDRVASADGRWAYTLYDGGDGEPFVHALDTVKGRAVCVDLDDLITRHQVGDVRMAMSPGGEHLTLTMHKVPLAVVDTGTLEASAPSSDVSDGEGSGFPWLLVVVAGGIGLAGVGAYLATRHHRARLATPDA